MSSIDLDPFEEIANLNSKAYDEGYNEGMLDGQKAAYTTGFKIGKSMAFAVGKELGECYEMCSNYLKQNSTETSSQSSDSSTNNINDKSTRLAAQIVQLIDKFDYGACHSEHFQTQFSFIKDKFKQFCSLANLRSFCTSQSELNFKLANNPKLSF